MELFVFVNINEIFIKPKFSAWVDTIYWFQYNFATY